MAWLEETLETLAAAPVCGYQAKGPAASEPTALAALALLGHGRAEPAAKGGAWLADLQAADGSVGVCGGQPTPTWPTSLAILAWTALAQHEATEPATDAARSPFVRKAINWTLELQGKAIPRDANLGHDTTLIAWPWCEGTHSWLEPTSFFVLALKAQNLGGHDRTREAIHLILDRQLAGGGCNYGNTVVLGQPLRPHVQPTGIALLALAGEKDPTLRKGLSLRYLHTALSAETTTASLCWALLGLAAHRETPLEAEEWLERACLHTRQRDGSPYKLALLALAALAERSPLITLPQRTAEK